MVFQWSFLLFFYDEGFLVVYKPMELFPRAHAQNTHIQASSKSETGFEHTMWGANPHPMLVTQLPGDLSILISTMKKTSRVLQI